MRLTSLSYFDEHEAFDVGAGLTLLALPTERDCTTILTGAGTDTAVPMAVVVATVAGTNIPVLYGVVTSPSVVSS